MEMMIMRPQEFEALYNCSFYNISDVPLETRQHVGMGSIFIAMFFIFEILYIPCLLSIKKHTESPCYKIMFYIGVNDMMCMCVNTFLTGYFAITGAVYCSHPTFIFLAGTFGLGCWASETVAEVTLALNRCIAICSPKWEYNLFRGYKTWIWMSLPTLYAFYFAVFTKPILFSGIYMSWFFNPHVGYYDDFGLVVHITHNYFVIVGLTATYTTFAVMLFIKSKKLNGLQNAAAQNYSQKMIFLQVVMISMINAVAAGVYVVMQFLRISQLLIYLGSIAWSLAHGIPPVIYLVMNKTLRRDAIKMCVNVLQSGNPDHSSHAHQPNANKNANVQTNAWSCNSTIGAGVHH